MLINLLFLVNENQDDNPPSTSSASTSSASTSAVEATLLRPPSTDSLSTLSTASSSGSRSSRKRAAAEDSSFDQLREEVREQRTADMEQISRIIRESNKTMLQGLGDLFGRFLNPTTPAPTPPQPTYQTPPQPQHQPANHYQSPSAGVPGYVTVQHGNYNLPQTPPNAQPFPATPTSSRLTDELNSNQLGSIYHIPDNESQY